MALKHDQEYRWLREVHSDVISQSLRDLDVAFSRFFKGLALSQAPSQG